MSINVKTLQVLMAAPGVSNRRGLRGLFWGPPGVGKTARVETVARAMGARVFTMIASIREPSDFLGLPMFSEGRTKYAAPEFAYQANEAAANGQLVLVLIDELTTCAPAVQGALLRVTNEGWVGDVKLHDNVVFMAAANPPDIAVGGYDLQPPMANRWMHLDWPAPTAAEWSEGMLSGWAESHEVESATALMARIDKNYPSAKAKAMGLVTGFLRANAQHLLKLPSSGDPNASRAWPSGRSWDMAIHALAGCAAAGLPETEADVMIQGCVGRGVAGELRQYQTAADLPDPEKLLDAKDYTKVWRHNPERPDLTSAVLDSCAALIAPKRAEHREARAEALWAVFGDVVKDAGDVVVMSARTVARAGLTSSPTARKVMRSMGGIMEAMGDFAK